MVRIETYLINGDPDQTRVYDYPDKNLRLTVLLREDPEYIRTCRHIMQCALYTLVWPPSPGGKRTIYIGHTTDASVRTRQHMSMERMFSEACVLTRIQGQFDKAEVMYLEHYAIVWAIEQGSVDLMENSNIPDEPYISPEKKFALQDVFLDYMMLVRHAGFDGVFGKRLFSIADSGYLSRNRISDRMGSFCPEPSLSSPSDDGAFDDDNRVIGKYVLDGADFHAECMELEDGCYMLLGGCRISAGVDIDALPSDLSAKIDRKSRSLPIGFISASLDDISIVVCGSSSDASWRYDRTLL